jgi:hypothetical protein
MARARQAFERALGLNSDLSLAHNLYASVDGGYFQPRPLESLPLLAPLRRMPAFEAIVATARQRPPNSSRQRSEILGIGEP